MSSQQTSSAPVVLVTGSSRGLGRGIAVELSKAGYSVAINYAGNEKAAEETVELCKAVAQGQDQAFVPVQGDISSANSREAMLEKVLSCFGRLDALVNNAGIAPKERADLTEATEASFDDLIQTNLKGPYFLTQAVVNHWLSKAYGSKLPSGFKVIFVTSISSHTASVSRGDYCISKAGLSMATQLWANRCANEGIQVYEVRPGIMKTDMTSGVTSKYDALIADGLVPQHRWGTAEDLGLGVTALVDGKFPFSTGTVIDIDGGFQMNHL
jgi:NAD(P)-dependent dehydrogenase (short-subunit alcohol dehydrogenase family)